MTRSATATDRVTWFGCPAQQSNSAAPKPATSNKGKSRGCLDATSYRNARRGGRWSGARPPRSWPPSSLAKRCASFGIEPAPRTSRRFHCVYPQLETPDHTAALVACLNATRVRRSAQSNQRVYGGGLSKLEPRDLLDIHVPDVRGLRQDTCRDLQARLLDLDLAVKTGADPSAAQQMLDAAVDAL